MGITVNGRDGINIGRVLIRLDRFGNDRSGIRRILDDMGQLLAKEARIHARGTGISQTGRMINSIRHRIRDEGDKISTTVSPEKIHYAIYQELGATRNPASNAAMFARLRELGVLGTRPRKVGFTETVHFPRPFMKPAFDRHAFKTVELVRRLLRQAP